MSLDGGPNLVSREITDWFRKRRVKIRQSSAHYAQSNGRAESAVKSLKRLLIGNTGKSGSIKTDEIACALLQHRNTPLRDVMKSPAELALGRQLRNTVPLPTARYKVNPQWAHHLRQREFLFSKANQLQKEKYDVSSKPLKDLHCGDHVLCQNVRNNKWEKSGVVIEVDQYRHYHIKMDGSGRISLRNRRHLRKVLVEKPTIPMLPSSQVPHHTDSNPSSSSDRTQIVVSSPTSESSTSSSTVHDKVMQPNVLDSESVNELTHSQIPLRRFNRLRKRPAKYNDYEL